jgi:hypothetical protein
MTTGRINQVTLVIKKYKLQKERILLQVASLYSSLQFHKETTDQESVKQLIDLSLLRDHVDRSTIKDEARAPSDIVVRCNILLPVFFFFPETAIKINFHNCLFDGRTKPRSHPQRGRIPCRGCSRMVCDIYAHRVSIHTSFSFASAAYCSSGIRRLVLERE